MAIMFQELIYLSAIFAICLLLALYFKSSIFKYLLRLKKLMGIFIGFIIIQSIFSPSGDVLLYIGRFTIISTGGLLQGVLLVLRIGAILLASSIMTTSSATDITLGLVKLKMPYELAFMTLIGLKFLPVLTQEIQDALTAIQLRGIALNKIPFNKKLKIYTYIFMPVTAGAFTKARKIAVSMDTKGFRAYPQRTTYKELQMDKRDFILIICTIIFSILMFWSR